MSLANNPIWLQAKTEDDEDLAELAREFGVSKNIWIIVASPFATNCFIFEQDFIELKQIRKYLV